MLASDDARQACDAFPGICERAWRPFPALRRPGSEAAAAGGAPGGTRPASVRKDMRLARDIMRSDVTSVRSSDALARAADLMRRLSVRELPVVDDGRVVGILSRTDFQPYVGHLEWTAVRIAMSGDPITVPDDATADDVRRVLVEHGVNAVPVVSDGRLVGIITRHDLLRAIEP
jgi:CBS domain-containing protein